MDDVIVKQMYWCMFKYFHCKKHSFNIWKSNILSNNYWKYKEKKHSWRSCKTCFYVYYLKWCQRFNREVLWSFLLKLKMRGECVQVLVRLREGMRYARTWVSGSKLFLKHETLPNYQMMGLIYFIKMFLFQRYDIKNKQGMLAISEDL